MDVKKDGDLRLSELNKSVTEEGGQCKLIDLMLSLSIVTTPKLKRTF